VYFSIGFHVTNWFTGTVKNGNGVTELMIPFMVSFSNSLSNYVFNNTSSNNLCYFAESDYAPGFQYYAIWDAMDCRLNVYLGHSKIFFKNYDNLTLVPTSSLSLNKTPISLANVSNFTNPESLQLPIAVNDDGPISNIETSSYTPNDSRRLHEQPLLGNNLFRLESAIIDTPIIDTNTHKTSSSIIAPVSDDSPIKRIETSNYLNTASFRLALANETNSISSSSGGNNVINVGTNIGNTITNTTQSATNSVLGTATDINWNNPNVNQVIGLPYFTIAFYFLLGGGVLTFIILIIIIMIILGVMLSMLMASMASILFLYILAYLSPIFVPFSLFKKTNPMFQNWLNLLLGTTVQPIVFLSFGSFIFALIDSVMFSDCLFTKWLDNSSQNFVFELRLPDDYDAQSTCKSSLGYNFFQVTQLGTGIHSINLIFFSVFYITDVLGIITSSWTALVMCFIVSNLMAKTYEISSQLSGGLDLSNYITSPTLILKLAKQGADLLEQRNNAKAKEEAQAQKANEGGRSKQQGSPPGGA
jgi:type IV secretory pathway VirB6-like protein